ncbi:MAG: deoxyribodipyrimidine photo-lyase [Pseudomonadota bacterium]
MANKTTLVWFRTLLRLADHPALAEAVTAGDVACLYVLDDATPATWKRGAASRWWLHHSLSALTADIEARGGRLILRQGQSVDEVLDVATALAADNIEFTRGYEPWADDMERQLHDEASARGIEVKRRGGHLLVEPEKVRTKTGAIYKVYTPFWRAVSASYDPRGPRPAPKAISAPDKLPAIKSDALDAWGLLPTRPNWAADWLDIWTPGEAGAAKSFKAFLKAAINGYDEERNRPDKPGTSRMSPHLAFGEIGPQTIWRAASLHAGGDGQYDADHETFLKEIVWREFSAHLLANFPHLPDRPFKEEFDKYPWQPNEDALRAWQKGQTGYPIVDAGMRELWATGWMHNRVRMITASFLIKHLMIPWQEGEAWFWDTLVDADLASNSASWQWVAGSGADASPYFRIFNPITQGQKFDPDGAYVRRWVPELADMPIKYLHAPFDAPTAMLDKAGVTLGETYPHPLVEHGFARKRALAGYDEMRA